MFGMRQIGYLCRDGLVVSIDDELLLLQYDNISNRFASISKFEGGVNDGCKEVSVNIEEQYSVKYFPRVYYSIFKLGFNNNVGYLLEQYDGTSASAWFYTCDNYKECKKLIEEFEEE